MSVILPLDIAKQAAWSEKTFGPGNRTAGIFDHMTKEMKEVLVDEQSGVPTLGEWMDLIILALDGAWRSGATPEEIIDAYHSKIRKNMERRWPDWRTAQDGKAIEHIREG